MPLDGTHPHPRAATEAAMSVALALAEAAGRADGIASRATVPFDPAMERLRYRLLLYAAVTRDDRLRDLVPEFRHRARSALRAYRSLQRSAAR